jgi:NAD(P)H-hydrate epimerase
MKILTAAEMRETDRVTVAEHGVASFALMQAAGGAVARFVEREYAHARRVVIFCGKGNNGGDGFVAARSLELMGRLVQVFLLGKPEDLKGDARAAFEAWGGRPHLLAEETALETGVFRKALQQADLLVDAVVGTGFQPPLRGLAAVLGQHLSALKTPVVAVDLPSGWNADSHEFLSTDAYRANAVVTFTAPKLAHVCGNLTGRACGPIVVADIGSPEAAIRSDLRMSWAGGSKRLFDVPRTADANKGLYGHVLVMGGAWGKPGAPSMSSLAALRAGAGLVTAAVPERILPQVASIAPELMTVPLAEGAEGGIAAANLEPKRLEALLTRKTVLALGPGMGQSEETEAFVLGLLEKTAENKDLALVLDADALNIVARHKDKLRGAGRTLVLTPHPGEMGRLAGMSTREVQADRETLARRFAEEHQVTLVLKGWRTLIAHPDGSLAINTTGNPGMAKGGSGDILTGIVAACVAQLPGQVREAVEAAVYLHGLAADFAVREQNEHTLLATDTIAHLHRAFGFFAEDTAGYTWLEGLPRASQ